MSAGQSRIVASIDLASPGRRIGHLRLHHSDNEHAASLIPVPIAVIVNGDGPTVLVGAGTHGDEYEGQVIVRRLTHELDLAAVHGRLILMPALNYLASLSGTRCWPGDGINMNRVYPGDAAQTPTAALAHYVESVLLPMCDFGLDLHSGGCASEYLPCVYMRRTGAAGLVRRKIAAARHFAAPLTMVVGVTADPRSLLAAGDRVGVPMISTELAGGGSLVIDALATGFAGVMRVLHGLGALAHLPPGYGASGPTEFMEYVDHTSFLPAPCDGLFEPAVRLGDRVRAGQRAGRIHSRQDLAVAPVEVLFPRDGRVVSRRVPAPVHYGDYLFTVASNLDPATLVSADTA